MILETFGYMSWKGAQDGVRGGIHKVVPPVLHKGTLEVRLTVPSNPTRRADTSAVRVDF